MEKTIEIKGMDQNLLFGPADINLKLVEDSFKSQIVVRGDVIKIDGEDPGSPENPKMLKKFIYCTGITTLLFIIILIFLFTYFIKCYFVPGIN